MTLTPPWTGDPAMAGTVWHHVAVVFETGNPGDLVSTYRIYLDGVPMPLPPGATGRIYFGSTLYQGQIRTSPETGIDMHGCDDLLIFDHVKTEVEIRKLAALPRHVPEGDYGSPQLTFDAGAFPDGAAVRGLAWDGFIPALTGGSFTFGVDRLDGAGVAAVSSTDVTWNGAGPCGAPVRLAGCRSVRARVRITTDPPPILDDGTGTGNRIPVLRDTPHLTSLTLLFADRPRWRGIGQAPR